MKLLNQYSSEAKKEAVAYSLLVGSALLCLLFANQTQTNFGVLVSIIGMFSGFAYLIYIAIDYNRPQKAVLIGIGCMALMGFGLFVLLSA